MMKRIFFFLCIEFVYSQQPVPTKPTGFTFKNGKASAGVQIDMFIDLLCPDSKAAQPALKQVVEKYQSTDIRLVHHLFPLPFHRNAYSVAQAGMTIVHALGDESHFEQWMNAMYNNQWMFGNKQTMNDGQMKVTNQLKKLAMAEFPSLTEEAWEKGMSGHGGTQMDGLTRTAWKYACSRGVTGTPIFFVNGIRIGADSSWTVEQWLQLVDPLIKANQQPLIQAQQTVLEHPLVTKRPVFDMNGIDAAKHHCTATAELNACEFANEKTMCCDLSEWCLSNRGCVASQE